VLPRLFHDAVGTLIRHRLASLESIHPVDVDSAEDDEIFFLALGNSGLESLVFPYGAGLDSVAMNRFWEWPLKKRDRFLRAYRRFIQQLLWESKAKRYVGKSAHFAAKLDDLHRWFPDACFVHTVRTPYEVIPSALSMVTTAWQFAYAKPPPAAGIEAIYGALVGLYQHGEESLRSIPKSLRLIVRYEDLIADPVAIVDRIYSQFELSRSTAITVAARQAADDQVRWKSRHRYSLGAFGVSKQRILRDLGNIFEQYGFPR